MTAHIGNSRKQPADDPLIRCQSLCRQTEPPLGDLETQVEAFVEHYNHQRYHESLNNVTPADAYFGRAATIIKQRERIKRQTIEHRRLQHRKLAA